MRRQLANVIDLDSRRADVFGRPCHGSTYDLHDYELGARTFYTPFLREVVMNSGRDGTFTAPCDVTLGVPTSRHVLGTLRMGTVPATFVVDANGKFSRLMRETSTPATGACS